MKKPRTVRPSGALSFQARSYFLPKIASPRRAKKPFFAGVLRDDGVDAAGAGAAGAGAVAGVGAALGPGRGAAVVVRRAAVDLVAVERVAALVLGLAADVRAAGFFAAVADALAAVVTFAAGLRAGVLAAAFGATDALGAVVFTGALAAVVFGLAAALGAAAFAAGFAAADFVVADLAGAGFFAAVVFDVVGLLAMYSPTPR